MTFPKPFERIALWCLSASFLAWSICFIFLSSFVAVDGKRYFCLFDDAMISLRYAWNLAHGNGLVWNAGEYVQGYTNFLMTLLMALPAVIMDKSDTVFCIQIIGSAMMLGIAYLTMLIADRVIHPANPKQKAFVRVMAFSGTLAYYPLAFFTLMGMETGLLTLLMLFGLLAAIKYAKEGASVYLFQGAVCWALAFLTRNDSIIAAAIAFAYVLWESWFARRLSGRVGVLLAAAAVYAAFVIALLTFQHLYYGDMMPNTYYLKLTGMSANARILNGIRFVSPYLMSSIALLAFAVVHVLHSRRSASVMLLAVICAAIGYQVYVGGDPWPYWRMMAPVASLMIVLTIGSMSVICNVVCMARQGVKARLALPSRLTQSAVTVAFGMALVLANWTFKYEILFLAKPYQTEASLENVNTALILRRLTTDNATLGVVWAGALPYYAERRAIDFLGKCDRHIARLLPDQSGEIGWAGMQSVPGHNKYDLNYSIKVLKPTYTQCLKWGGHDLREWAVGQYVKVEQDGAVVFLLKDSPDVIWDVVGPKTDVTRPSGSGVVDAECLNFNKGRLISDVR